MLVAPLFHCHTLTIIAGELSGCITTCQLQVPTVLLPIGLAACVSNYRPLMFSKKECIVGGIWETWHIGPWQEQFPIFALFIILNCRFRQTNKLQVSKIMKIIQRLVVLVESRIGTKSPVGSTFIKSGLSIWALPKQLLNHPTPTHQHSFLP